MTAATAGLAPAVESPPIVRPAQVGDRIVVTDGLPGCGKTMMSAIVAGLPRVELMQYAYEIEYACVLNALRKLTDDAAQGLVRLHADIRLYNSMMARETNFRVG